MGSFTKSHNLKKLPIGNWRSLHGYGAAHLVHGRLLLSGLIEIKDAPLKVSNLDVYFF